MSLVRKNMLANLAGRSWAALISLAFVPVYIWLLGIEAYGLIGVYLTLYGVLSLFDLGLGATLNRELARRSVLEDDAGHMRDVLRTLELVYWLIGLALGLLVVLLGPTLAFHWIKTEQIPPATAATAVQLMGAAFACQWPLALYSAGLQGLQDQVKLNVISSVAVTVRSVGAVVVLWAIEPSIQAFLAWQLFASLAETLVTGAATWRRLPPGRAGRFDPALVRSLWRFAAGAGAVSVCSVILSQLDKILLSALLPLSAFGYYMVASRLAAGLYFLVSPVTATYFPRFSQLLASGREAELRRTYHQACQILAVLVVPPVVVLTFFSWEVLFLWTRNGEIAHNGWLVLSFLAAGTLLNALATPPHILQLASGWIRLALVNSLVMTLLMAPLIYFMTVRYGGAGAAAAWLLLNAGNVLVNGVFTHRRLLVGELGRWFRLDIAPPLLAALAVGGAWRWLLPTPETPAANLANLVLLSLAAMAATAMSAPEVRRLVFQVGRLNHAS